jgi:hypothetical protein
MPTRRGTDRQPVNSHRISNATRLSRRPQQHDDVFPWRSSLSVDRVSFAMDLRRAATLLVRTRWAMLSG